MSRGLRKWVKANVHHMTVTGCEVVLGNYNKKTKMRELSGFRYLGDASAAIKRMGLKRGEYVLLYNTSLPAEC